MVCVVEPVLIATHLKYLSNMMSISYLVYNNLDVDQSDLGILSTLLVWSNFHVTSDF